MFIHLGFARLPSGQEIFVICDLRFVICIPVLSLELI
jgi:hypothetical protein